tara:strand:- start:1226 stop:1486 length:261 start_codon:yes stop_codon:yes gene_type:complete
MEKLKIFDKSGKRMLEEEEKMREMNKVFEKTLQEENDNIKTGYFSGPARQVINDFTRQFKDEDTARVMRHARKAGRTMRSRKIPIK